LGKTYRRGNTDGNTGKGGGGRSNSGSSRGKTRPGSNSKEKGGTEGNHEGPQRKKGVEMGGPIFIAVRGGRRGTNCSSRTEIPCKAGEQGLMVIVLQNITGRKMVTGRKYYFKKRLVQSGKKVNGEEELG